MICFEINNSQIYFGSIVIFWFSVSRPPPLPHASIFFKYVKATMLSLCIRIEVKFWLLRNVWRTNLTASSSNSLICHFLSWNDHFPPINVPWRAAPQPVNDVSVWSTICGACLRREVPLKIPKFFIHHRNSCFKLLFKVIFARHNFFSFKAWLNLLLLEETTVNSCWKGSLDCWRKIS